jgi:hypothetical protein
MGPPEEIPPVQELFLALGLFLVSVRLMVLESDLVTFLVRVKLKGL